MAPAPLRVPITACAVIAGLSLLAPSAPSYDPWSWLIWGRELAGFDLDTSGGPAFKPLAVMVTTPLALLGDAAPQAWLVVARAGALLALLLAFRLARRLTGQSVTAGLVAAGTLALADGFLRGAWAGATEGLVVAGALLAVGAALDDRHRTALRFAAAVAALRVEVWPLLAVYGIWCWRRDPALRAELALFAVALPVLWLAPDAIGSGELGRSSQRARTIDDAGAPGLSARPFTASLAAAGGLVIAPLLAGAVIALRRRGVAACLVLAGVAWTVVVATMAELGYSGEARYALPAAAAIAVGGAVGLHETWRLAAGAALPRGVAIAVATATTVLVAGFALSGGRGLRDDAVGLGDQAELTGDLGPAISAAGGREALMRCGQIHAGTRRGPLVAWHLRVAKRQVRFAPRGDGVVLRSRLRRTDPAAPRVPAGYERRALHGRWEVWTRCRV